MSKDNPDALNEFKKGLGHLFNAAKTAVQDLPTKDFEDAVLTGVKEVGRALGNVKDTLETELLGKTEGAPHATSSGSQSPAPAPEAHASAPPPAAAAQPPADQVRISAEPPAAVKAPEPAAASAPHAPDAPDADTGGGI